MRCWIVLTVFVVGIISCSDSKPVTYQCHTGGVCIDGDDALQAYIEHEPKPKSLDALTISNVTDVDSLNYFDEVERIGALLVTSSSIRHFKWLKSLQELELLELNHNKRLINFEGLERLKSVNNSNPLVDHRLRGNPVLENFKGLENVEYWKGGLFVEGSPKFNSVNHLKSLKISDGIVLTNTSIEVLGPMMSLEKTTGLSLLHNQKLKKINIFPNLKTIHNGIQFEYNP